MSFIRFSWLVGAVSACTNILVTPGASADGHSMISYNADSAALHGALSHWPAGEHAEGEMRQVYSWDLGIHLGAIPEAQRTYNVMGNANCQGLVIGETTLGGLSELSNVGKDYRNGVRGQAPNHRLCIASSLGPVAQDQRSANASVQLKYDRGYEARGFESHLDRHHSRLWAADIHHAAAGCDGSRGDRRDGEAHRAVRLCVRHGGLLDE